MEQLYLNIINNLRDGIYYVDKERKILFWNKAAEEITGYPQEEIVGMRCQETHLNHIDEEGHPLCIIGCPLFATLADGKQRQDRVFVRHRDGYRIPIHVNIFPIIKDGEIEGAVEVFTQDSPTVYEDDLVEKLSNIAMHDQLTRLPNRRYLESFLRYKMEEFQRFGRLFAVLFADIDNFGSFNNQYGHDLGDSVLRNIAASIKRSVRRNDLVGRWGGEEYVGIYSIASPEDIGIIGEKFRQLVHMTEVEHEGTLLTVTVSVGITVVQMGDTLDSVVERADALMYRSKKNGKDRVTTG
ncbi:MAG: GGDEF domain-containing protein [Clostridia bacterium]|nr:GGDEF domain-containing protein [Clostridia bacterium]MBQ3078335.1 GGDEF domain-containing protein [Clostridia bacterium]